jgi:hypothetical protein
MVLAVPAGAQSIKVRTVEIETGRAIAGAIVVLLDSTGRRVVQGLTDDLGRITLTAPVTAMYRVKADRIGHPGITTDPFNSASTATLTLEMPGDRFELPEIAVSGSSVCGRSENAETAQLWEEIRKALSASQITSASQSVELSVRRFVRSRSLGGQLRKDSTTRTFTTRISPFVTADPASLVRAGYIQGSGNDIRFLGPDAHVLLSDDFLDTHCFRMVRAEKDMPGAVGLGFEPVKGRQVPRSRAHSGSIAAAPSCARSTTSTSTCRARCARRGLAVDPSSLGFRPGTGSSRTGTSGCPTGSIGSAA